VSGSRLRAAGAVIVVGALYFLFARISAALAGAAGSPHGMQAWRFAAFVLSALLFAAHIGLEHFRGQRTARATAAHVAFAVALGAFGLAVAANLHSAHGVSPHRHALLLALVVWPVGTALPAFLVAWALAAALGRTRRM
jgi:hypothetical protein